MTTKADRDDYYDDERDRCDYCGGEGHVEYIEHPELWGEDCPSLKNHLLTCPECHGMGWVKW